MALMRVSLKIDTSSDIFLLKLTVLKDPVYRGNATPAIMPIITITIINSIMVKPQFFRNVFFAPYIFFSLNTNRSKKI